MCLLCDTARKSRQRLAGTARPAPGQARPVPLLVPALIPALIPAAAAAPQPIKAG